MNYLKIKGGIIDMDILKDDITGLVYVDVDTCTKEDFLNIDKEYLINGFAIKEIKIIIKKMDVLYDLVDLFYKNKIDSDLRDNIKRVRIDLYPALNNSYAKKNFPWNYINISMENLFDVVLSTKANPTINFMQAFSDYNFKGGYKDDSES